MGVKQLWTDALGLFSETPHRDISDFAGMTLAVDLSIWLNKLCSSSVDKLATTCRPTYPAPDLLQNIQCLHDILSEHVNLVYVFDGKATKLKDATRQARISARCNNGADWFNLCQRARGEPDLSFTEDEIEKATESRMKMKKPTAADHANVLQWLKSRNVKCIGSLEEADLQMVKLEKDGIVDGIISEDGDEFALGAKKLFCKMKRNKNGHYQFKLLDRDVFFNQSNPYKSNLNKFPDLIVYAALLLGNDYCPRIDGNGAGAVVLGSLPRLPNVSKNASTNELAKRAQDKKQLKRREDSMLHQLAASKLDKKDWLLQHGSKGTKPMPDNIRDAFFKAEKYMNHAPVLELCKESGVVSIVPLNELPAGETNLSEFFDQVELGHLMKNKSLLHSIYHCDILPLERKPLDGYTVQSTTIHGTRPAQLFEVLNFDEHPVCIQPKPCLVNWLRARGYDARFFDERKKIVSTVLDCLRLDKTIRRPRLQPIIGQHDGFFGIRPRVAGNSFDNWNADCLDFIKRLEPITDNIIDALLGPERKDRPATRLRVMKLFSGGFYDLNTLKCRNVEAKSDGSKCVLMCCDCLSSTTKVIHKIYAIFEDKTNGKFLLKISSCSCKNGPYFCSHSIGFLFTISILQRLNSSIREFTDSYRINPQYIQGELMLVENYINFDRYKAFESQSKRQRNNVFMEELDDSDEN